MSWPQRLKQHSDKGKDDDDHMLSSTHPSWRHNGTVTMKLTCDDFAPFIDTFVDGEFDELEQAEARAHLDHCESCRHKVEQQLKFKQHFRASLGAEKAPEHLRTNIMELLEQERASQRASQPASLGRYGLIAAPLAAILSLAILAPNLTIAPSAASDQLPIVTQPVEWHRGNYPMEISSAQPQEITRWFSDKVTFPVRIPQFQNKDAKLIGARLAHIQDRRAAFVLYDVNGTKLSVMMFQGDGLNVPSDKVRKIADRDVAVLNASGYDVAVMQNHGVTYTITSELPEASFVSMMEASLRR